MQFRRSGQRDQRRRKVFREDASPEAENSPTPTNKTGKSDAIAKAYSKAAVEETETRIADLIPSRPLGVCVLFLLGLTAIAGVQALHTFVADWSSVLGADAASAFDVSVSGSLNGWLSSLLLGMGAMLSVLIYVIRRHKMDDYRGLYRMWLWTAGGLTLLSINNIAGLHRALDGLVVFLSGKTLLEFVPGWSLLLISFVGGIFALRMLMDMWRSRGASAAMVGAGLSYIAAALLIIFRPLPIETMLSHMVSALAFSMGHLLLSLSLMVYARRVLLEARGLIQIKKKQPKAKPAKKQKAAVNKVATEETEEKPTPSNRAAKRKLKIDPPHQPSRQSTQAAEKPKAKITSSNATSPDDSNEAPSGEADKHGPAEGSPEWLKLSKAQRRRVKKLRRRSAAAAA